MELRFVYITCSGREEARTIGRALVEARLAACINIVGGMNSMYWWDGEIQDDYEAVLIAKTRAPLMPRLITRVRQLHSYEVPCVVSLELTEGNQDFLNWIHTETGGDPSERPT
jgi:periplasmic divalent cation tolerance protein